MLTLIRSTRQPVAHPACPAIAAAVLSLLIYAVTLGGTYIYDDISIIRQDPRIQHPQLWGQFWTKDYFNGGLDNLYRPLVSLSYAMQWWIHGDTAWAFHLVNCLLHAAVAGVVAEFTRRCAGRAAAYISGLLFAAHPIHVEAVANIVGRAELACALGIFGALLLFCRRPLTGWRTTGILACEIAAVLSKEQGILVPALLFLLGWCVWSDGAPPDARQRRSLRWLVILITWCTAGYLIGREHFLRFEWDRSFLDWATQPMIRSAGKDRWLMPIVLVGHYFQLLVFPIRLSPDYGARVIGWNAHPGDPYLWLGVLAIVLWILATAIAFVGRNGFAVFCLLSLAITYAMVGNIVALIGTNFAERLMYLPSAFFLIYMATLLGRVPIWRSLLVGLITLASVRSFTYARRWNDRLQFYQQSQAQQPQSLQLYLLLGTEYVDRHDLKSADAVLARGSEAFPDSWMIWMHRGLVAMELDRLDEAQQDLQRAFELSPNPMVGGAQAKLSERRAATRPPSHSIDPRK